MGLLNITNLEDGVFLTANMLNERFGAIADTLNGNIDAANIKQGSVGAVSLSSTVFERFYPIGSLYMNATVDTNPAVLLGFGTWVAFGAGRVPVGYNSADTDFNAAGKEIGDKTTTLTVDQMPAHSHGVNDPGHSHGVNDPGHSHRYSGSNSDVVTNSRAAEWSNAVDINAAATSHNTTGISISGSGTGVSIQSRGGGQPHSNLQPSVVVYMWRRTA